MDLACSPECRKVWSILLIFRNCFSRVMEKKWPRSGGHSVERRQCRFEWIVRPSANNGAAAELYGTFGQSKRYRATGNAT
jgi:hypothetical protein